MRSVNRLLLKVQEAEALEAVKEVEAAHAPTGYRAKTMESAIIIDDLPRD